MVVKGIRRFVRLEAEIVAARDFMRVGGRLLDLSEHGARAQLDERVVVGETLLVSFVLPEVGFLDVEARVTETLPHRLVDLELSFADEATREALRGRLSKLPPVLPRRPVSADETAEVDDTEVAAAVG